MSKKSKTGGSPSVDRIPVVPEASGMFGVPLEDCVPSPHNEVSLVRCMLYFQVFNECIAKCLSECGVKDLIE